ncbi:MAG: GIY-YIG nuclease family protein [Patescibacteria group bacterium]
MSNKHTLNIKNISKAPQTIGIYQFLRGKEVLYVGKAVNIKARLASHLQNARLDPKEAKLIAESDRIKVIPTPSEFAALLLEAKLIQQLKPKYNVRWRDNKSYLYIRITATEYPKVILARANDIKSGNKDQFFGPFQGTRLVQDLIREIRKVVPFCTRPRLGKSPCFHSKIGQCDPCPNLVSQMKDPSLKTELKRKYRRNIRQVKKILKGQTETVTGELEKQIKELSQKERYEEALVIRNRLIRFERLITQTLGLKEEPPSPTDTKEALTSLREVLKQYLPSLRDLNRIECYDVSNLGGGQATASLVVLTDGQIDKSQYKKFKIKGGRKDLGDVGMMKQVIERRFKNKWPKPDLIVVDGGKPQVRKIREALKALNNKTPLIGIAKGPDRLVIGIEKLPTKRLPITHPGFNLIRLLRDESHRFSRGYHLLLRSKTLLPK